MTGPYGERGAGWRAVVVGLQWLGALHLPAYRPELAEEQPEGHPECVLPLSALPRRERAEWAWREAQLR
jgi:hypothetical protein